MASISLIRKFFAIRKLDNNVSHIQSNIVAVAVDLTDKFIKSIADL